jgi:hypothetical protein
MNNHKVMRTDWLPSARILRGTGLGAILTVLSLAAVATPGIAVAHGHGHVPPAHTGTASRVVLLQGATPGRHKGYDVAISGGFAVVGAPGRLSADGTGSRGTAFIYARSASGWSKQKTLTDGGNDGFGQTVAISGNIAIVGAAHRFWIYTHSGHTWHREGPFAPGAINTSSYIQSIAISGKAIALGLPLDSKGTGNARVFTHNHGSWGQHAIFWFLNGYFHKGEFAFGSAVAISGDTVAVGTKFQKSAGAVHIYIHAGGDWHQQTQLLGSAHKNFGSAVAISGSTMAIGAPGTTSGNGAVYMYRRHGSRWALEDRINPPGKAQSSSFGHSLALSGGRLLIGADNQTERKCGAAYEYVSSGSSWAKRAAVINPGCTRNDAFGYSLGISGQTAVIGAPGANNSAGAAYVESVP